MTVTPTERAHARHIAPASGERRLPLSVLIVLFLISCALLFGLRGFRRPGADSGEMMLLISSYDEPVYYFRSPLTFLLHQYSYRVLKTFGWNPSDSIGLCSAVAGGFYVVTLFLFSRHLLFLFVGHVENYAWVNMLLAVYFYLARDYLYGRRWLFPATLAYVAACLFHMLALFYFPAWLYLFLSVERKQKKVRIVITPNRADLGRILALFVGAALFVSLGPLIAPIIHGLDIHRSRLVPLFHNPNPTRYFFTMFSLDHARMLLHFIRMESPLGIPLLVLLAWRIRSKWHTFLLIAFLCGFAFAILWHPDMGKNDWDLFSTWAIPLNLLVGLLLAEVLPQKVFYILSFLERTYPSKQNGRNAPEHRTPAV
jgi:hypothetical protein